MSYRVPCAANHLDTRKGWWGGGMSVNLATARRAVERSSIVILFEDPEMYGPADRRPRHHEEVCSDAMPVAVIYHVQAVDQRAPVGLVARLQVHKACKISAPLS